MPVKRGDWKKATPLPAARATIALDRQYSRDEFARLIEGHFPEGMEDKWFAYFEDPWLYLHRSWTGYCIYQVRFERSNEVVRVAEVLVNRNPVEYHSTFADTDSALLAVRLDKYAGRDTSATWELASGLLKEDRANAAKRS